MGGAGAGTPGTAGAAAGISGAGSDSAGGNGGSPSAGSAAGGADTGGGSGGLMDPAQSGGAAGNAGGSAVPLDCSTYDKDATYYSVTRHCYLVVHDQSTYADAQASCSDQGGHLVTIASKEENEFVWNLDPNEHWIGTSDGKGPKESAPGTYTWITGEVFNYHAWSNNQPDAATTSCGDSNGGGDCHEHCGFQWTGGEHPGQWNDRYCLHTINSVCEWDE